MAQFDIHRNKGALRESIPFVVVVGSLAQEGQIIADAIDELLTRSCG